MDAIVLVGGQGTRLRPLTRTRHKSLVPVCNRPAIGYLFDWLRRSGIRRAVLALGQNNEDLAVAYPDGDHDGLTILTVLERDRLESGGAIRNAVAAAGIEGRFVVLNGDVFVDFDLRDALRKHAEEDAALTLALYPVEEPSQFGVAVCDARNLVIGFVEKPPPGEEPSNLVNAGVWIFEPDLVAEIPPGPVRVEETLFPSLVARRRRVFGYQFSGIWADVGTHARYLALHRALLDEGRPCLAPGARIHDAASIMRSAIGPDTDVAEGATIIDSVLWEGVTVTARASIESSIIADGVSIGPEAFVAGAVIGSGATISPGARLDPGTIVEPGSRYD